MKVSISNSDLRASVSRRRLESSIYSRRRARPPARRPPARRPPLTRPPFAARPRRASVVAAASLQPLSRCPSLAVSRRRASPSLRPFVRRCCLSSSASRCCPSLLSVAAVHCGHLWPQSLCTASLSSRSPRSLTSLPSCLSSPPVAFVDRRCCLPQCCPSSRCARRVPSTPSITAVRRGVGLAAFSRSTRLHVHTALWFSLLH